MSARIDWTDEMLAALRRLRSTGTPLYECSLEIGVCYASTVCKARELGLAGRINRGTIPGRTAAKQRRRA